MALDQEALGRLRRTMGSEEEFRGMLEEFLSASARVVRDLETATQGRNRPDAERAAHTLKSMSRMVGASDLADSCAQAELEAAQGHLQEASVAAIVRRARQAQEAVRACLA